MTIEILRLCPSALALSFLLTAITTMAFLSMSFKRLPSSDLLNSSYQCRYLPCSIPHFCQVYNPVNWNSISIKGKASSLTAPSAVSMRIEKKLACLLCKWSPHYGDWQKAQHCNLWVCECRKKRMTVVKATTVTVLAQSEWCKIWRKGSTASNRRVMMRWKRIKFFPSVTRV